MLDEQNAFMPLNPYSASKAAADLAAFSYSQQSHLTIIRARRFNHSGSGQLAEFVIPAFAQQIAKIEAGLQSPTMQVGNLTAQRCFLHVQDVVNAYILLLKNSSRITSGSAFNIVSDMPVSIAAILEKLLALSSLDIQVVQDPSRQRPTDIPIAQGSSTALQRCTGWSANIDIDELLIEVLDDQRQCINTLMNETL
jgi:GDP-4-dehydro-6-deoxy-D-mannose reductase